MAARLMTVRGVKILCDHNTYAAVVNDFVFKSHDLVFVKGSQEQLEVYQPTARSVSSKKEPWDSNFVGREEEKKKLIKCLFSNSIALVLAPEGYGKSKLLEYTAETSKKIGFTAYTGIASKMHQQVPYFAISALMKQVLRLNTAYYELDAASKVLYVSQQIEFVVERFWAKGIRGMGSANFMNVETSARFERPTDGISRRSSVDSEVRE